MDAFEPKNVFQIASICLLQTLLLCGDQFHKVGDLKSKHAGFTTKAQITPPRPIYQKINVLFMLTLRLQKFAKKEV